MIFKNAELFNVEELIEREDGGFTWLRIPKKAYDSLDNDFGRRVSADSTGVEIRFKQNCDKVVLRMATTGGQGRFHIFRGNVQGGWQDHEVDKIITEEPHDFVIERPENPNRLKDICEKSGGEWSSEVTRVIFDIGGIVLYDIIGDVEPPKKEDCPRKTLMCHGSSITHGSNSIDMSHSWPSLLGHSIGYDVLNKGMSGSCHMEREYVDYIAQAGKDGVWDALTLELGINVIFWEDEKIYERATYAVSHIAAENPDKPIFVISPFYHCGDDYPEFDETSGAKRWRKALREITDKLNLPNVTYIDGLDILNGAEFMSADFVHPNIYGVAQIADRLTKIVKPIVESYR